MDHKIIHRHEFYEKIENILDTCGRIVQEIENIFINSMKSVE